MSYRILIADITTNDIYEQIPFDTFKYDEAINAAGVFNGTVSLRNPKVTQANLFPMRCSLYVERHGKIVWSGMITKCSPNTETGKLQVEAAGLWAYAGYRTLNETRSYLSLDQTSVIAHGLLTYMNAYYNIGWALGCPASGVLRDRQTYYGYERRTIKKLIEELSSVIDGFDFAVQSEWEGNQIVDTFRTFYPYRGRRIKAKWVKYPSGAPGSNIDIIAAPVNGQDMANQVHAIGAGEKEAMRISTAVDPNQIGPYQFPLIEGVTQHKSVRHSVTLLGHAENDLLKVKNSPQVADLTLRDGHSDTEIGLFSPGDQVELMADDGWITMTGLWRILSYKVKVDPNGAESTTAKIIKIYT